MIPPVSIYKPHKMNFRTLPLEQLKLSKLEGIQKGIPLFDGVELKDIAFLTKNFETLNLFRGCVVGCSHCLKASKIPEAMRASILFEDLVRFVDGFKTLNERLGFNTLSETKYLNIVDDSNPSDFPIKGKSRNHSVVEGIKLISEKLHIPVIFVTSGWNKVSKYAQNTSEELVKLVNENPTAVDSVQVSINPFSGLMERSRKALLNSQSDTANFWRNAYTSQMANTLKTFLDLFKNDKALIIYRHALNTPQNELVSELETRKLYQEIYTKLKSETGSALEDIPQLHPDVVTAYDKSHLIEPSGRGRRFFTKEQNLKEQSELISEALDWEGLRAEEKYENLRDGAVKCVDIDGRVYTTMPSLKVESIATPIELTIPTNIQLNYEDKRPAGKNFSDIDLG